MRKLTYVVVAVSLVVLAFLVWRALRPQAEPTVSATVTEFMAAAEGDAEGFLRATEPGIEFPDAFGPHPEYQIEWWYYTGNVQTVDGRPFGYQLTFFRRGLRSDPVERESRLATNNLWMAHFAVTDGVAEEFHAFERLGRDNTAGAQAQPYEVWLDNWEVKEVGPDIYTLEATAEDIAISLRLVGMKEPVLHGDQGLSAKGTVEGNASYYYSQTRLESYGRLKIGDTIYDVTGASWKDHEWSTSALMEGAVGWDWFSLQLSDGREIMYGQLRNAEGEPTFASGTLVYENGEYRPLSPEEVEINVLDRWTSESGVTYPAAWTMDILTEETSVTITPLIADQELQVSVLYWEGAVEVGGSAHGSTVTGRGYVELTGYSEPTWIR